MHIDKNGKINDFSIKLNTSVPSKQRSDNELKKVDVSSSDALNSYGRAIIHSCDNDKKSLILKLDKIIKLYEKSLNCEDKRKEEYISLLKELRHNLEKTNQITKQDEKELLNLTDENNVKYAEKLLEEKTCDKYRFNAEDVAELLSLYTSENKDIIDFAVSLKDKNGNCRFDAYGIWQILKDITPKNLPYAEKTLSAKDKEGNYRFEANDIPFIYKVVNPSNEDIFEELLNARDKEGNYRFNKNDIRYISDAVNDDNKESIKKMIYAKTPDGRYRFSGWEIAPILDVLTSEKTELLNELINLKNDNGDYRFDSWCIASVFPLVNEKNITLLNSLIDSKNEEGQNRYSGAQISNIFTGSKSGDEEYIEKLNNLKDSNGNYRFNADDIAIISGNITSENKGFIEELINYKDKNGEYRFDSHQIIDILQLRTDENKDILSIFINSKDKDGEYRFNYENILSLIGGINSDNIPIINSLIEAEDKDGNFRFDGQEITDIFHCVNPENKDIFYEMLSSEYSNGILRYSPYNIHRILNLITKDNRKIFDTLNKRMDKYGFYEFDEYKILYILEQLNSENIKYTEKLINLKDDNGDYVCDKNITTMILNSLTSDNINKAENLVDNYSKYNLTPNYMFLILNNKVTLKDIKFVEYLLGKNFVRGLSLNDIILSCNFKGMINKQNINEISMSHKREIVRNLVSNNTELFNVSDELKKYIPLLPKSQEEYCTLLPSLVKSLGIETDILSDETKKEFYNSLKSLASNLSQLSDEDFNNLTITQEYSKNEFIKDAFELTKNLNKQERQKVYDYFGFELYYNNEVNQIDDNKYHKYGIIGYPVNLNNGKKLSQITNPETKQVVEKLREKVIKFSQNNNINCNNKEIENELNIIVKVFPELRTQIDKIQHSTHAFDIFKHSLKVMQKIVQEPQYSNLSESDKRIMLISALLHDTNKTEGKRDSLHSAEGAFDAYYIINKLNLSKEEKIKIYSLIKHHEWLGLVNNKENSDTDKKQQSVAFDLQYDNLFDMAKIFTVADLKSVKTNDSFYHKFKDDFEYHSKQIDWYIKELKKTQPLLPVTKIPSANKISEAITTVNPDGSTNIKGVYKIKEGLIVLKFNEIEDWEKIGFPKGAVSRGIAAKRILNNKGNYEEVETGNIKFFAHGLDYPNQLIKFDAFALPDSDALLSVSYAELPESKYRFFRTQGVLLNTDTKYIHGGGETDAGSGCCKNTETFKNNYLFGGYRYSDRVYVSDLIKKTLNLNDEQYINFVKENKNKSFDEINPEGVRNKLIKAFATMNSNLRKGDRSYNEMYITNPEVMGVFAYSPDDEVGDINIFISKQEAFLKKYAIEKNIPFVVFGN